MGSARDSFPELLDALRGHSEVPTGADPDRLREAERLLERGRAIAADARVPRAWLRRAARLVRSGPRRLGLVFDSWFEAQPALRRPGVAPAPRFLRFEGEVMVDLEIAADGVLRGQIAPPDAVREVSLTLGGKVRRVKVGRDGTFRIARLPHGSAVLELGAWTLENVPI